MTNEMREKVNRNIELSNGSMTIEFAKAAIEQNKRVISYWEDNSYAWESKHKIAQAKGEIEYFMAVIEVLTELAEVEVANEVIQVVAAMVKTVVKATVMRKVVAKAANQLRKLGYSLSDCFKRAWSLVKGAVSFISYPGSKTFHARL